MQVGDIVVYPGRGVVKIKSVRRAYAGDSKSEFFVLECLTDPLTILIPVENTSAVRPTLDREDMLDALSSIKSFDPYSNKYSSWAFRYRDYMKDINSGDVAKVGMVRKTLEHISKTKNLSFGERKVRNLADTMLVSEIQVSLGLSEVDALNELNKAVA